MTTGRTINKYSRVYVDGYDLSCYTRTIGPLTWSFMEGIDDPLCQDKTGVVLGQATISPGTLNGLLDNTATVGIHALANTPPYERDVIVAIGMQAVPAIGDPAFVGQFRQDDYITGPGDTPNIVTIKFGPTSGTATTKIYDKPWGTLLHVNTAAASTDGANTAVGVDQQAASSSGGYMIYEVLTAVGTGDITATIKVQDADTNVDGSFGDLLSSGEINCGAAGVAVPTSGVVALSELATVKQFVRWQIAFNTATSVTFVLAFVRK
jgi:hypothetical protein